MEFILILLILLKQTPTVLFLSDVLPSVSH